MVIFYVIEFRHTSQVSKRGIYLPTIKSLELW